MFLKNSKLNPSQGKTPTLALPSPSPVQPAVPRSLISADIVVNGDITAAGDIQIEGVITGNLRAAQVTIGQKATIRGDVVAEEVIVRGHVVGTITGRRVQLSGTSYVEGDIRHESMGMEMGARLDGCCRHTADPLALAAPIAPAALPKPVSLARAALRTEDRSAALAAANADPKPAESRGTAMPSEPGAAKDKPAPFLVSAPAPDASVSPDGARPSETCVETLKSTGFEMRAKASKSASGTSGRKAPAAKSAGKKPDALESALPAEEKKVSPPHSSGTQPAGASLESGASPEPVSQLAAMAS